MNGYRCFACSTEQTVDFAGFVCPACGGNLEITYDHAAIGPGFGAGEGMFRYEALLPCPDPGTSLPLTIGGTPLHRARRLGASAGLGSLWLKDETGNPSASIKDRASAVALLRAAATGADTVAVASTGNAGSSTACLAAAMGLRAVVFVPETAPPAKLAQSLAYGARVLAVRGSYDDAYDLCMSACAERGWFNRSTGFNPFTRDGKKTVSFEIWEQLGGVPDRVIVPTGDGNILSGAWKGWRDLHGAGLVERLPRIDCVQSEGSAAICRSIGNIREHGSAPDWHSLDIASVAANTVADSISVDQPRDGLAAVRAVIESGGEAVTVTDDEILAAVIELASVAGVFAEPAAAATWAAAKKLAVHGKIGKHETVVLLITGNGLKDVGALRVGEPERVDADPDALRALL
jgi:threonine synthase